MCEDKYEFDREKEMLLEYLDWAKEFKFFIYFSTISIQDSSLRNLYYIKHKLAMEALVLAHKHPYVIRLGQVASKNKGNPNNLLNFLSNAIKSGEKTEIWSNSYRNIIDIENIAPIVSRLIIEYPINKNFINVANPISNSIQEIINALEDVMEEKGYFSYIHRGEKYHVDVDIMMSRINNTNVKFDDGYLRRILKKYYST